MLKLLHERTAQPVITYKSISGMASDAWEPWLTETKEEYGINFLSFVGSPPRQLEGKRHLALTSHPSCRRPSRQLHLGRASSLPNVIAQNAPKAHASFIRRATAVASLSPKPSMMLARPFQLLNDYYQLCLREGIAPTRIILTFIPCGRAKTLEFMRWLGVGIAA